MDESKNSLSAFSSFLLFAFLGAIGGCVVGLFVSFGQYAGIFSSWETLETSLKFNHIIEAAYDSVWAQSSDGKIYAWNSNCYVETKCDQWDEVDEIPDNLSLGQKPIERAPSCMELGFNYSANRPNRVIECVKVVPYSPDPEFGMAAYYVLLDDGQIRTWRHSSSLLLVIFQSIAIMFLGILLSVILFVASAIYTTRKQKKNSAVSITPPG